MLVFHTVRIMQPEYVVEDFFLESSNELVKKKCEWSSNVDANN